ncbi:MAG: pyruvate kinase [Candidatus Nomurabacteria bacterium]|jgi:pyruvate kinase|nr:pyruvate kinase [Candidatus Nomurabacteria bacterium]
MEKTFYKITPTFKRTKIIATVGPSTNSYDKIRDLVAAGANCLRMNFSHGTHQEKAQQIEWGRQASKELGKPVALYADLQGPKIRLGDLDGNHFNVKAGDELTLKFGAEQSGKILPIQYDISTRVKPGERVFLFDGHIRSTATAVGDGFVKVKVENDGFLMSRKGVNMPDTDFSGEALTPKDYKDLEFIVKNDYDYVALSFVNHKDDVEMLREQLAAGGSQAKIIAKLETRAGVAEDRLEKIVQAADAVMVARGDLAYEVEPEAVPTTQREIIRLCQKHSKISIVATQMMLSMVDNPMPTRAEVNDVAHAVIVGADCVMLSDETANGHYPIEAVKAMKRVILYTENNAKDFHTLAEPEREDSVTNLVAEAAAKLARRIDAAAIVAQTSSGRTAYAIAAERPHCPIISVTSTPRVGQQLTLLYANKVFLRDESATASHDLAKELIAKNYLPKGSKIVTVSGAEAGKSGATNTLRVFEM